MIDDALWGSASMFLLDIGASGGVERRWSVFGDRLKAIGFDPLVAEVERLNRLERRPGVRYEAAFVGARNYDSLFPPQLRSDPIATRSDYPWSRVSAIAAQQQLRESYIQLVFNAGAPVVVTERHIALDDFIPRADHLSVDFVKIDTDGHDIEVLLGAEEILTAGGVLGLSVEMQHQGAVHSYANTFDNIDRFLRGHGFSLFVLRSFPYSRTALRLHLRSGGSDGIGPKAGRRRLFSISARP
jgi:FkbM family methyltransferase